MNIHKNHEQIFLLEKDSKELQQQVFEAMKENTSLKSNMIGTATTKQKEFASHLVGKNNFYHFKKHPKRLNRFDCHCIIERLHNKSNDIEVIEGIKESTFSLQDFVNVILYLIKEKGYAFRTELIEIFDKRALGNCFDMFRMMAREREDFPFNYTKVNNRKCYVLKK